MWEIEPYAESVLGMNTAMSEAIKKFKEAIQNTETIAVRTGKNPDISKIISGMLLHRAFVVMGKKSDFELPANNEKIKRFVEELCGKIEKTQHHEHLIIKVDGTSMPVSRLKYEKEGEILKIILESAGELAHDKITLEKEKTPVDLLMLIDPPDTEVEEIATTVPHHEIVKLSSKQRALGMKVADIIMALMDPLPRNCANALWYLIERVEMDHETPAPELWEIKKQLLDIGVDHALIKRASLDLWGTGFWKLLGRALARSEFEKGPDIIWTFLPQRDFQKTNQVAGHTENTAKELFANIKHLRTEGKYFAFLWERGPDELEPAASSEVLSRSISAIVGGNNIQNVERLAEPLGSSLASDYFLLNGFGTFSEAELKIRTCIQRVL